MQKLTDIDSNKLAERLIDTLNNKKIQMIINSEQTKIKNETDYSHALTFSLNK